MAENNNRQEYVKIILTLVMSLLLILFTQWVKLIKNPKSTPITKETIFGLVILGVFSILGIFIHGLVQKLPIKIINDFPILGWVSMVSLAVCIVSPQVIEAINSDRDEDIAKALEEIAVYAGEELGAKKVRLEILKKDNNTLEL